MRAALVVAWMVPLLAAGCASEEKAEPEPAASIPLELDPTQDYELSAWWTNDSQMLHLGEANAYALYDSLNRYRQPVERGRWWQQSYAAIWLEPYAEHARKSIRASVRRDGQTLTLNLPGLAPMTGLGGPPRVLEDRLLGRWSAEFGTLRLDDDLRYVYTLNPGRTRSPAAVTKHGGAWQVEDDVVILRPDSAGVLPVLVRIREADGTILLEAPEGPLARQAPVVEGG